MNSQEYTLTATGGALIGVGFTKIDTDVVLGIGLIVGGVVLQIAVAVLQKYGIPISARIEG